MEIRCSWLSLATPGFASDFLRGRDMQPVKRGNNLCLPFLDFLSLARCKGASSLRCGSGAITHKHPLMVKDRVTWDFWCLEWGRGFQLINAKHCQAIWGSTCFPLWTQIRQRGSGIPTPKDLPPCLSGREKTAHSDYSSLADFHPLI